MNKLWKYINKKEWKEETKYRVFILVLEVIAASIGLTAWLIVRNWALSSWDWAFCFIGYPLIASWFAAFLYSCRHT